MPHRGTAGRASPPLPPPYRCALKPTLRSASAGGLGRPPLSGLDLDEAADPAAPLGSSEPGDCVALGVNPEAALALLARRYPDVAHYLPHVPAPLLSKNYMLSSGLLDLSYDDVK